MNHCLSVERRQMASKPGGRLTPGISLTVTCLLVRWCPAQRWRDLDSGFSTELREPVVVMTRERYKRKPREANSTKALHRDGQIRSSDGGHWSPETAVMAVERRGLVTQLSAAGQLNGRPKIANRRTR